MKNKKTQRKTPEKSKNQDVSALRWHIRSRSINEFVFATDQFAAWDTLRERSAEEFGLIAQAELNESGDPFPIRTVLLMQRWGRMNDAKLFANLERACGIIG